MASNVTINRLTNANIYADGNSFLGRAEEINLPVVKFKTGDHKALGMIGAIEYFAGIDKLEGKIKWNSYYPEVLKKVANPFEAVRLQVRASLETYEGGSRTAQKPAVVYLTVSSRDFPLGNFKQHDNVELENNYGSTYCKLEIDGEEIVEIDLEANIFKVGGVDLLAEYRANLGI